MQSISTYQQALSLPQALRHVDDLALGTLYLAVLANVFDESLN